MGGQGMCQFPSSPDGPFSPLSMEQQYSGKVTVERLLSPLQMKGVGTYLPRSHFGLPSAQQQEPGTVACHLLHCSCQYSSKVDVFASVFQ